MPRTPRKTKEEKAAEEFFPISKSSLKNVTEKDVVNPSNTSFIKYGTTEKKSEKMPLEKIEKIGNKKIKAEKIPSRKYGKISKISEYEPQKTKLKENGYELIITEKPQAALKIASSLGKFTKKDYQKVPYYEVDRDGKKIIVGCAVGHLFTLKQDVPGSDIPIFDIKWVPNYLAVKNDFTKRYHDALSKLAKNAGSLTVATDYDVEGEVIGLNIVRFICGQKDAERMKFSTLTSSDLNESYENKSKNINWGQAIAGETRHYLDWFYGINISRALMNAIKSTGRFRIMSIGRVQGPALNLIVQKEKEIKKFISKPYWQIFISVKNFHTLELKHNKDIFDKSDLKKFENLIGKAAMAETKKTEKILPPNPPFNLSALQTESYNLYGITPSRTLQIAQSLYLSGLISYPRTSSQKLPDSINYRQILGKLAKKYNAEKLITRSRPHEGEKNDPAHPSIYPTGEMQILSGDEEKIYNLIARRFLSLFCEDAVVENKTISVMSDNLKFSANGYSIKKKTWMEIYPSKLKETEIPDLAGRVEIIDSKIEEKETRPPNRYSPASIISELEKKNLGTKATRSSILETLYDRDYIKEKSIEATPLGLSLIETLEKYSPIIIDEKLTREFEEETESISESKKDFDKKEKNILDKSKEVVREIVGQFKKYEKNIGEELLSANVQLREQQKKENTLNLCPVCRKGSLAITYSKKNRRHFIACDSYPECKTTYSLPPNGAIKKTDKLCDKCGFPKLMLLKKGRSPWFFCFNRECAINKERIEAYKKTEENKI